MATTTKHSIEEVLLIVQENPEAKKALEKLFPEYFEDDLYFNLTPLRLGLDKAVCIADEKLKVCIADEKLKLSGLGRGAIELRTYGKYAYKGFYLNDAAIDWKIMKDGPTLVLLPTKKKK